MAAAVAGGVVLGGALAASVVGRAGTAPPAAGLSLFRPYFSTNDFFSCRRAARTALMPSCLSPYTAASSSSSSRLAPPWRQTAALPWGGIRSLSSPCWSRSSFVGDRDFVRMGLAVGADGNAIRELKRAAVRRRRQRRRVSRTAGLMTVTSMGPKSEGDLEQLIQSKNSKNAVVLYSKTWCPYCGMVKDLFNGLGVQYLLVELDNLVDELDVQDALTRLTNQSTIPSVFIGGKHIGGCDDTMALHDSGDLVPTLEAAGAKVTSP